MLTSLFVPITAFWLFFRWQKGCADGFTISQKAFKATPLNRAYVKQSEDFYEAYGRKFAVHSPDDSVKSERSTSGPHSSSLLLDDVTLFGIDTALAEEHLALGNYDEAEQRAKEAIELGKHTEEVDNVYEAYAQGILADALFAEGLYEESARTFKAALKAYERHYRSPTGPETVELFGAMQLLSWTLLVDGDYPRAKIACTFAVDIGKRLLGPDSTSVATAMVNLATAFIKSGDDDGLRAKELYTEAKRVLEARLEHSPTTSDGDSVVAALGNIHLQLGNLEYKSGRDVEAERHFSWIDDVSGRSTELKAETVSAALKCLGVIRWRRGELRDAERLLGIALLGLERSDEHGPDHPLTERVRSLLIRLRADEPPPQNATNWI